jgi:heat shock protein HslJ
LVGAVLGVLIYLRFRYLSGGCLPSDKMQPGRASLSPRNHRLALKLKGYAMTDQDTRRRVRWTMSNLFLATVILVAASAEGVAAMPRELAGTTWRWISFTSASEALTIPEPDRYILTFRGGDNVSLRADCNRGAGNVTFLEPGVIRFGALAITRAMCPPGSLSDRFARDVGRVVRWAVRGGELRLELPEDAGTLRLTRQP